RIALEKVKGCAVRLHSVHKHPALGLFLCVRVSLVNLRSPFQRETVDGIPGLPTVAALDHLLDLAFSHQGFKIGRGDNPPGELRVAYAKCAVDYFHSFYYLCGLLLQELSL
ncbi:hypothetical protein, partial [uncultured Muribaculum sp.]|uniref:hypothetical protein n=1 Tax=uncultured Muribaculum sp. TaxID=1918613 RepID=UPI0025AF2F7E